MLTEWTIEVEAAEIDLEIGQGGFRFVVTNIGPVDDRAVFEVIADTEFHQGFFAVDQREQTVRRGESVTFVARVPSVSVTPEPGGSYRFTCRGSVRSATHAGDVVLSRAVTITLRRPVVWTVQAHEDHVHVVVPGEGTINFTVTNHGGVDDRAVFEVIEGALPDEPLVFVEITDDHSYTVVEPERIVRAGESVIFEAGYAGSGTRSPVSHAGVWFVRPPTLDATRPASR